LILTLSGRSGRILGAESAYFGLIWQEIKKGSENILKVLNFFGGQ
jgi:hypothetical protein